MNKEQTDAKAKRQTVAHGKKNRSVRRRGRARVQNVGEGGKRDGAKGDAGEAFIKMLMLYGIFTAEC